MTKEKIRILHVLSSLRSGGVAVLLYNYFAKMDKSQIAFDYIVHVPDHGMIENKLAGEDTKVYHLPRFNHLWSTFWKTRRIIKNGNYRIVHVHHTSKSFIQLFAAWSCGVPVRIAHSHDVHTYQGIKKIVYSIYNRLTTISSTHQFACSKLAGNYVFGKICNKDTYLQINNAIDVDKYKLDDYCRYKIRQELGVNNKYVIMTIGRFSEQKNPFRLLTIFKTLYMDNKDCILIHIGKGELENEVKQYTQQLGVENNVIYLGERDDVPNLLQAADLFLLPSLHEGLGIVLVEAQVTGLPCITSLNVVPEEVNLTGLVHFVSLDKSDDDWSHSIKEGLNIERTDQSLCITEKKYNLNIEAQKLQNWYLTH